MKKIVLFTIALILLIIGFVSGCIGGSGSSGSDFGTCIVIGFIGFILFIILIAYLLGHKKTNVNVVTSASPPVYLREGPSPPTIIRKESKETAKSERRCPECGRVIPDDAKLCPYCGKKFRTHFIQEQSDEVEIIEPLKDTIEQKQIMKQPKYCPECGTKLEGNVSFCTNCGNKLD